MLSHSLRGEGDLVVLLHGLLGNKQNLAGVAKALEENFCVCSVDLPNHGDSVGEEKMSFTGMMEAVMALVDQFSPDKPVRVLGHSLGGKVAMLLALEYPHRVSHLIVEDIAPVGYPHHHRPMLDALLAIDLSTLHSRQEADQQLQEAIQDAIVRQFILMNLRKYSDGYRWRANIQALSDNYPQLAEGLEVESGKSFSGKTLFIAGEKSRYIKSEHVDIIKSLFPDAQFRQVQGVGHWIHVEKPQLFNALVARFFNEKQ